MSLTFLKMPWKERLSADNSMSLVVLNALQVCDNAVPDCWTSVVFAFCSTRVQL